MCGIFAALYSSEERARAQLALDKAQFEQMKSRGPDSSWFGSIAPACTGGFHRLRVFNDSLRGEQPIEVGNIVLMCNGEIYNSDELFDEFEFPRVGTSDCEIIAHLLRQFSVIETCQKLQGEFAFVVYDRSTGVMWAARDYLGMRPLYISKSEGCTKLSSTLLADEEGYQLQPRAIWCSDGPTKPYTSIERFVGAGTSHPRRNLLAAIRTSFLAAVRTRMYHGSANVGVCLSGGLDSSLVAAGAVKAALQRGLPPTSVHTFSIGLSGSPDLESALTVAQYLGTSHHALLVTEGEMLEVLRRIPAIIGSHDVTTVRASTAHYMLAAFISRCGFKVVLSGEFADELSASYAYFANAPSIESLDGERLRLLRDVHHFDGLRADRATAAHGLEVRFPFGDQMFVRLYGAVAPEHLAFGESRIDKAVLREAFKTWLPVSILTRAKNGMSDGCSPASRSWHHVIQEEFGFADAAAEGAQYRKWFEERYAKSCGAVPYQWMPRWTDTTDPSARDLTSYSGD